MGFRVATWNINSVRLRLGQVERFLREYSPDVLCLQETKCPDDQFPAGAIRALGYEHIAIHGQKGYHGVATLSRHAFAQVQRRQFCGKDATRHVAVRLDGVAAGAVIHNFYVPAGGDEPDPAVNDKFAHKLGFLDEMRDWFAGMDSAAEPLLLVGDLNIAPLEDDVWSHRQLLKVVSHTPVEVEKLGEVMAAGKWIDIMRQITPAPEKLFSWWSYRARNWQASNRGRRLDHVWATPALAPRARGMEVVLEARSWERPSDHAPVIADFDL